MTSVSCSFSTRSCLNTGTTTLSMVMSVIHRPPPTFSDSNAGISHVKSPSRSQPLISSSRSPPLPPRRGGGEREGARVESARTNRRVSSSGGAHDA